MLDTKANLPENAFLQTYKRAGHFTDCYAYTVPKPIGLPAYIRAFYTSGAFRTERFILGLAVSKPSTQADVDALAAGQTDTFAAWDVEARDEIQILLRDFQGNTCSWLMALPLKRNRTRLYFGSTIVKRNAAPSEDAKIPPAFSALMGFHKLYSRILITSAAKQLALT